MKINFKFHKRIKLSKGKYLGTSNINSEKDDKDGRRDVSGTKLLTLFYSENKLSSGACEFTGQRFSSFLVSLFCVILPSSFL